MTTQIIINWFYNPHYMDLWKIILTLKSTRLSPKIMLLIIIKMEENLISEWNDYLCIGHSLLDIKFLTIETCLIIFFYVTSNWMQFLAYN